MEAEATTSTLTMIESQPSFPPMATPLFLLILLFLPLALGQPPPPPQRLTSGADLAGLFSLRASLSLRARDWPRKTDPCSAWFGVSCLAGRVVGVDVSGFRRTRLGRRNPRFAVDGLRNLTLLSSFSASGFALPGSIPDWFGTGLPRTLAVLDLRRCGISGSVPSSLGNLAGLERLFLSGNSLSGEVPASLGGLRRLAVLDLGGNGLTGQIPAGLGGLLNLTDLDLSFNNLSGSVPEGLGTLRNLRTLVLANNRLSGPIPPVLGDLSSLVVLDLSGNSLSGSLPEDLRNIRSLQVLDLGANSFAGALPGRLFSGLMRLRSLTLSRNNFSGALPDSLWALPELGFIDVAYNDLSGTLPDAVSSVDARGVVFNLSHNLYYGSLPSGNGSLFGRLRFADLSDNYFQGFVPLSGQVIQVNVSVDLNCFRNATNQRRSADCAKFYADRGLAYEGLLPPNKNQTEPFESSGGKSNRRLLYILVGVFGGLLLIAAVVCLLVLCLKKCAAGAGAARQKDREAGSNAGPAGGQTSPPGMSVNLSAVGDSFTYDQLAQATSNFNEANLFRHGHSGELYHGVLDGGSPVVVKRIDIDMVKRELYLVELDFFARTSHTRLVPLLGHCLENENVKFLVYKYMPNGDLSNSLYRKPGQGKKSLQSLDWITRLKIATGVAEALCYLHHECTPPIVHRDIQASSILLDDKFEVRLGSLSEVCAQESDGNQSVITRLLRKSQTSEPSTSGSSPATCIFDVYCLGKVLLELVTGKLGISGSSDAKTNEWLEQTLPYISIYEKELLSKILDPSLIVDDDLMEEVWAMAIVAKACLNPKPSKRPQVKYILKALENPLKVVREENISNSARLRATSSRGSWNAAVFGSWRSTSDTVSISGPPREVTGLKHSGGSQGSPGEQSFNHRKPSKEIFPEPSGGSHEIEE